jgi:hypothetical protein
MAKYEIEELENGMQRIVDVETGEDVLSEEFIEIFASEDFLAGKSDYVVAQGIAEWWNIINIKTNESGWDYKKVDTEGFVWRKSDYIKVEHDYTYDHGERKIGRQQIVNIKTGEATTDLYRNIDAKCFLEGKSDYVVARREDGLYQIINGKTGEATTSYYLKIEASCFLSGKSDYIIAIRKDGLHQIINGKTGEAVTDKYETIEAPGFLSGKSNYVLIKKRMYGCSWQIIDIKTGKGITQDYYEISAKGFLSKESDYILVKQNKRNKWKIINMETGKAVTMICEEIDKSGFILAKSNYILAKVKNGLWNGLWQIIDTKTGEATTGYCKYIDADRFLEGKSDYVVVKDKEQDYWILNGKTGEAATSKYQAHVFLPWISDYITVESKNGSRREFSLATGCLAATSLDLFSNAKSNEANVISSCVASCY